MRLTAPLLSLCALAPTTLAQGDQHPIFEKFNSWVSTAKSYIPSPDAAKHPAQASSASIAAHTIHPITTHNWRTVLNRYQLPAEQTGGGEIENWMVQITGGNKTCGPGRCESLDAMFNETAALLSATPHPPRLGRVDCDASPVLCTTWFVGPPAIWYVRLPLVAASDDGSKAEQSPVATDIHVLRLNASTSTAREMAELHTKSEWQGKPLVTGALHPFDGWAARFGLNIVMGYVLAGVNMVPSWTIMLGVSFVTRMLM